MNSIWIVYLWKSFVFINSLIGHNLPIILTIIGLYLSIRKYQEDRPHLSVRLSESKAASFICLPYRDSDTTPDPYWHRPYRVLMDVIITNNSAKPISIDSFNLVDKASFHPFFQVGEKYSIPLNKARINANPSDLLVRTDTGSEKEIELIYNEKEAAFKFPLDLPPYSSRRGKLVFALESLSDVSLGDKNKLTLSTSRGPFSYQLVISVFLQTVQTLPEKYRPENIQTKDNIYEKANHSIF